MINYKHISDCRICNYFMDTDSFVLSVNTKDIIKDLKNLEDLLDFSNLNESQELFSNKNKKVIGKFKIQTRRNVWIVEFVSLRSKMYSFKCGDDSRNKIKEVSKSYLKNIKFEEYKKRLDGEKYQEECENYILRSVNNEMYLQKIKKPLLSIFDDKRCYKNETKSTRLN